MDLSTNLCTQAAGLIGCFRFLEGFYLLLVTQRRYHGTVCGKCQSVTCTKTPAALVPFVSANLSCKSNLQDDAGQKVYGIDKTLLVPLVQPSVDIVQGQVSLILLLYPEELFCLPWSCSRQTACHSS